MIMEMLQRNRYKAAALQSRENERKQELAQFKKFMDTEYFRVFMEDLNKLALETGLDVRDPNAALEANGQRRAYLSLLNKYNKLIEECRRYFGK